MCRSRWAERWLFEWAGRWNSRAGRWAGRWDNWCIVMMLKGAASAGDVVKGVGDDRFSRGFGIGIYFKSEACSRNEVVEVLDETGLIGQVNVISCIAKFRIKLVGDEVKLEGCVELRDDEAFVSGAVQKLGRTVFALILRMK